MGWGGYFRVVNCIFGAVRCEYGCVLISAHFLKARQKREFQSDGVLRRIADKGSKAAARLPGDKRRFASHVASERIGVLVADPAGELDAGVGIEAVEGFLRKLRDVLMRDDNPDVLFAGLFEDHGEIGIGRKVILRLVDVDEAR